MSITELQVMSGLQTILQAMSEFEDAEVTINDWAVLDGEMGGSGRYARYAILRTSDDIRARQDVYDANTGWNVLVGLYVEFEDWDTSFTNFRTLRQAVVDKMNTGNSRSAGGLEAFSIDEIRNQGPITPYYPPTVAIADRPFSTPDYLMQWLVFDSTEF